jgi:hypothetical protein
MCGNHCILHVENREKHNIISHFNIFQISLALILNVTLCFIAALHFSLSRGIWEHNCCVKCSSLYYLQKTPTKIFLEVVVQRGVWNEIQQEECRHLQWTLTELLLNTLSICFYRPKVMEHIFIGVYKIEIENSHFFNSFQT